MTCVICGSSGLGISVSLGVAHGWPEKRFMGVRLSKGGRLTDLEPSPS